MRLVKDRWLTSPSIAGKSIVWQFIKRGTRQRRQVSDGVQKHSLYLFLARQLTDSHVCKGTRVRAITLGRDCVSKWAEKSYVLSSRPALRPAFGRGRKFSERLTPDLREAKFWRPCGTGLGATSGAFPFLITIDRHRWIAKHVVTQSSRTR